MSSRLTRRELGLAALSTAAFAQAGPEKYGGALDGFQDKLEIREFDPIAWTLARYESAPLRLTFQASDRRQAEAWQKRLRVKLVELLGGFPRQATPLASRTLEIREFPGYRRERFIFESRPGLAVLGYLLTPMNGRAPFPVVLCNPGHGRGVDDIIGVDEHGEPRSSKAGYQHDFALQVVEHGMAAVAIEPMAFGCRRDAATRQKGLGATACQPSAGAALLLGETMIGWRVYDITRTIDWIETRPELKATRVGCMGISGGGTCTLFSTAIDLRIKAAFVSGYLNTFRSSIMSISHCIDNYVPGILNWAEMYDVAGLIAPRPLFAESGDHDPIFPVAASRESFARVKKVYDVFGVGDVVDHQVFDAPHEFNGARGLPFLAKALAVA